MSPLQVYYYYYILLQWSRRLQPVSLSHTDYGEPKFSKHWACHSTAAGEKKIDEAFNLSHKNINSLKLYKSCKCAYYSCIQSLVISIGKNVHKFLMTNESKFSWFINISSFETQMPSLTLRNTVVLKKTSYVCKTNKFTVSI